MKNLSNLGRTTIANSAQSRLRPPPPLLRQPRLALSLPQVLLKNLNEKTITIYVYS
jgi:hypothetical protein